MRDSQIQWREFACGWGAACINITMTYPIHKIVFRQMLYGIDGYTAFKQLHQEGIQYLYRGMLPPLCQKTISFSIMFGVYGEARRRLTEKTKLDPYSVKALSGLIAGSTEATLMPFERVQTLLADAAYYKYFKNTFDAFKTLASQYGLRECYRGFTPIVVRNGLSNACFFIMRDEIRSRIQKSDSVVRQTLNEFICGAVVGVAMSILFYPLNVVKIGMQTKIGGEFENMFTAFRRIYKERGGRISSFYYGVPVNIVRAFFSWGIVNSAYEHLRKLLYSF